MEEDQNAERRKKAIEKRIGSSLAMLTSNKDVFGRWVGSFDLAPPGPVTRYDFTEDGSGTMSTSGIGSESIRWELKEGGVLSIFITIPPVPHLPSLEEGTEAEESYFAFKTEDAKLVLSNDDTSLVQILHRD